MSVSSEIETIRTESGGPTLTPRVFDVSDVNPSAVTEYAAEVEECYFERKGGRTFLITR